MSKIITRGVTIESSALQSGDMPGYQLAYLSPEQSRAVRAPASWTVAIRIDGARAQLVRLVGDYTARMADAQVQS